MNKSNGNIYWQNEVAKIYNESNLDTMARMPDNFIDLTVTSPPYDNLRQYNGYVFDFENGAKELYRVTKVGGVVVWVVADATIKGSETGTSFRQALFFKEIGFRLHDTMIYHKSNPMVMTHNRYEQAFEYIFVLSKGRPIAFNPILEKCKHEGLKNNRILNVKAELDKNSICRRREEITIVKSHKTKNNVFSYVVGVESETGSHPAIFPFKLAYDMVTSWSNEGDLIYDPFGGSGTTCKAAAVLNRKSIMSEISEEYCQIAKTRVSGLFSGLFAINDSN
jgi:site-specific DNA-methyltransferase (adenine-specific)